MQDLMVTNQDSLTMSSREIAELTGKQHSKVMDVVGSLVSKGIAKSATLKPVENKQNFQLYNEYFLDKRDSLVLVARLSPEFTAAIVDRWQELEEKQPQALPSPKQLALMVIKAEEEKEAALIEVDRLQGVCQTITAQFAKGVTAPKFTKQLNGVNTQQVNNSLIELGLLRRTKSGIVPTSYARDRYFIEKQDEHNGKLRSHSALTLTGAKWLYRAYLSSKLPMKKTWDGSFIHVVFED